MPESFDPAGIITAARQIFQDAPEFLAAERDRLQLILVDDIQEANPAVFELLADIAAGKDVLVTSSPDTVVQGFRGARPDLVAELPRLLAPAGGAVLERPLWTAHRHSPGRRAGLAGRRRSGSRSAPAGSRRGRLEQPAARTGARRAAARRTRPSWRRTCCRPRSTNCATWRSGSWRRSSTTAGTSATSP